MAGMTVNRLGMPGPAGYEHDEASRAYRPMGFRDQDAAEKAQLTRPQHDVDPLGRASTSSPSAGEYQFTGYVDGSGRRGRIRSSRGAGGGGNAALEKDSPARFDR